MSPCFTFCPVFTSMRLMWIVVVLTPWPWSSTTMPPLRTMPISASETRPAAVARIGVPFGTAKSTVKAIEATSTIKDGADEIEVVAHVPPILALDLETARAELMEVVRAARATRKDVLIRVITEFELLMELPLERREPTVEVACRAIRESGCDGVITGTGYHPAGAASAESIALVKKYGEGLTLKAALMDDLESAQGALSTGADLIGSEAATQLLEALR